MGSQPEVKGEGLVLSAGSGKRGKSVCLGPCQVNMGVTLSVIPVMTKSKQQVLSESYGEGWFFMVSHFLEQRMVGGFLTVTV